MSSDEGEELKRRREFSVAAAIGNYSSDDEEEDNHTGGEKEEEDHEAHGSLDNAHLTASAAHALSNLTRHSADTFSSFSAPPSADVVIFNNKGISYPLPPNYRIPETKPLRTGRWTLQEHKVFLKGVSLYGRTWTKVADMIGTRSAGQVRSHAQKFDLRLAKESKMHDDGTFSDNPNLDIDAEDENSQESTSLSTSDQPQPRKKGGGRPRGSTKEKLMERAAQLQAVARRQHAQLIYDENQQYLNPTYQEDADDPYLVDAHRYYRDQQAARTAASHFYPPSLLENHSHHPPLYHPARLAYTGDEYTGQERMYRGAPSDHYHRRAPPTLHTTTSDWRAPGAIDTLIGRFNVQSLPPELAPSYHQGQLNQQQPHYKMYSTESEQTKPPSSRPYDNYMHSEEQVSPGLGLKRMYPEHESDVFLDEMHHRHRRYQPQSQQLPPGPTGSKRAIQYEHDDAYLNEMHHRYPQHQQTLYASSDD